MKHKTRKLSISAKIVIFSAIILIFVVGLLGLNSSIRNKEELVGMAVDQAGVAAKISVNMLDADAIAGIAYGDTESEEYLKTLAIMDEVSQVCGIEFMYILINHDGVVEYMSSTDGEAYEPFEYTYEELKDVFDGNSFVQDFIDYTEYGALITTYEPIKDSNGNVVAVLGSDYNADEITASVNKAIARTLQIGIGGLILACAVLIFVSRGITRSIWKVNDKIFELANHEGDLTQTIDIKSGDEMEVMATNLNSLLEYIRRIMTHISEDTGNLSESTVTVSDNVITARDSITDVSATMEEMSAGMQETTASLTQINEAIGRAFETIKNIADNAASGNGTALNIQNKANDINDEAQKGRETALAKTETMIKELGNAIEKSKAVEQINALTDNIISITEQTNLLSLNASIEAARAGEAGRGFAVVADEIGKLAKDSGDAAVEIRNVSETVINAVSKLAEEAQAVIELLQWVVSDGYGNLINVSNDYNKDATDIHNIMEAFAADANEFTETMNDIRETLDAINTAVEESAKGIVSVAEISTELTESMSSIGDKAEVNKDVVKQLEHEVRKFKI